MKVKRSSDYPKHAYSSHRAYRASMRHRVLEEAANTCDAMIVGGRAWTESQAVAADALFAAANNIRAMARALAAALKEDSDG